MDAPNTLYYNVFHGSERTITITNYDTIEYY
jgi:hypothetical protein